MVVAAIYFRIISTSSSTKQFNIFICLCCVAEMIAVYCYFNCIYRTVTGAKQRLKKNTFSTSKLNNKKCSSLIIFFNWMLPVRWSWWYCCCCCCCCWPGERRVIFLSSSLPCVLFLVRSILVYFPSLFSVPIIYLYISWLHQRFWVIRFFRPCSRISLLFSSATAPKTTMNKK